MSMNEVDYNKDISNVDFGKIISYIDIDTTILVCHFFALLISNVHYNYECLYKYKYHSILQNIYFITR